MVVQATDLRVAPVPGLTSNAGEFREDSEVGVSSLMDTWTALRNVEVDAVRSRAVVILKARGTAHSQQVMGFSLSRKGVMLHPVGPPWPVTVRCPLRQQHGGDGERAPRPQHK